MRWNPVWDEIWFQIMFLTNAKGNNAIRLSFLSVCRNLKATLIPVQLNYGGYPTSWLPGIFGFDLKLGRGKTACEWKSTDAKVQCASTFHVGLSITSLIYSTDPNTKLLFCSLLSHRRRSKSLLYLFLVSFMHSFNSNRNHFRPLSKKLRLNQALVS